MAFHNSPTSTPLSLLLSCTFFILISFAAVSVRALNVGIQAAGVSVSLGKGCSRKCESDFCSVPPFLRYGKYCGLLYSGCPGEIPCDALDACCMKHDACVQAKNGGAGGYLSQECSQKFLDCMTNFKNAGGQSFKGNTCPVDEIVDVLSVVMRAALLAGRYLHKP